MRFALTVGQSLERLHPECDFFILAPDASSETDSRADPAVITPDQLSVQELSEMRIYYDAFALSNNLKPFLISFLLDRGYGKVVYLDSDTFLVGRFDRLFDELNRHSFVLTPHWTNPALSHKARVSAEQIVELGVFNGGLMGFRNDPTAREILDWLKGNLTATRLQFADQKFLALAAQLFGRSFKCLDDPGYNIAYWNLHERDVSWSGQRYEVGGSPVVFFHLSGFKPETPHLFSVHGDLKASESPIQGQIIDDFLRILVQADDTAASPAPAHTRSRRLSPRMRRYYLQHRTFTGYRRSEVRAVLERIRGLISRYWPQ
jgi:hypothetical protein